ncbi:MAG: TetR/AcrR family transcriptional regulator [Clostridia bacterium]|nr:TetR/AcrR family transcriptional regulator [Clostridia bacterium]
MKGERVIRETLINNTICLVAEGGFEAATTKAITYSVPPIENIKMNEVYIYRLYGSKENLYGVTFEILDQELIVALRRCIMQAGDLNAETEKKLYKVFLRAWRFLLGHEKRCRCYIRYYHSVYFTGDSLRRHNVIFDDVVNYMSPLFRDEVDVKSVLHCMFMTMFDFAVRVFNKDLENNEENRPHIFYVLYNIMVPYFREGINKNIDLETIVMEENPNEQAC